MKKILPSLAAILVVLGFTYCGLKDNGLSNLVDPTPIVSVSYDKKVLDVAQVTFEIDIDGKDILTVKDGRMVLNHDNAAWPENPTVYIKMKDADGNWVPIEGFNPYDVWELAWHDNQSNELDMKLPGLLAGEFNRISGLVVNSVHCYTQPITNDIFCGSADLTLDNKIVFDDDFPERGIYNVTFEYTFTKFETVSTQPAEAEIAVNTIGFNIEVYGSDTLIVNQGTLQIRHGYDQTPTEISVDAYQNVDSSGNRIDPLYPEPYYKVWIPTWSPLIMWPNVYSISNLFDLALPDIIAEEFEKIANLRVVDYREHPPAIVNSNEISFDDLHSSGRDTYSVIFEYWFTRSK